MKVFAHDGLLDIILIELGDPLSRDIYGKGMAK